MSARINEGLYPWKPPIGYTCQQANKRGEKKKAADRPDPETFPIIQQGLREFATGLLSKADLARRLDELGLAAIRRKKTYPQYVETLLTTRRLKFYVGLIENPWTKDDVPGQHQPMLTFEEYHRLRLLLSGARVQPTKHSRYNELFPLRRTVMCGHCQAPLTGSTSRGNGGTYPYYHCRNKVCTFYGKAIAKKTLEEAFMVHVATITPKPEFLNAFKETVLDLWHERAQNWQHEAARHEQHLAFLKGKRAKIFQMYEDGLYEKGEFTERKESVDNEMAVTKIAMNEARIDQFDIEATLNYAIKFIANLGRFWFDLTPELRPRFQQLVFPDGLPYTREKGFGTAKLGLIYELLQDSKGDKSKLVHHTGFGWNRVMEHVIAWRAVGREWAPERMLV
jgi:hypothetical protein